MTMISPQCYLERMQGLTYLELIRERDRLIDFIQEYEKAERTGTEMSSDLSRSMNQCFLQVMYQVYHEYLSVLSQFMQEKYNKEYVWGKRTLRQDVEENRNGS